MFYLAIGSVLAILMIVIPVIIGKERWEPLPYPLSEDVVEIFFSVIFAIFTIVAWPLVVSIFVLIKLRDSRLPEEK